MLFFLLTFADLHLHLRTTYNSITQLRPVPPLEPIVIYRALLLDNFTKTLPDSLDSKERANHLVRCCSLDYPIFFLYI